MKSYRCVTRCIVEEPTEILRVQHAVLCGPRSEADEVNGGFMWQTNLATQTRELQVPNSNVRSRVVRLPVARRPELLPRLRRWSMAKAVL